MRGFVRLCRRLINNTEQRMFENICGMEGMLKQHDTENITELQNIEILPHICIGHIICHEDENLVTMLTQDKFASSLNVLLNPN